MPGACFVMQYFVSFLVLQSSCWGREGWLLNFCGLLNVMFLLSFFASSSMYLLVIFAYYLMYLNKIDL